MQQHSKVLVGIPTYRRPAGLATLLSKLAEMDVAFPVEVIVAENDSERREGEAVCRLLLSAGYRFALRVVDTEGRGISEARNAIVAAALESSSAVYLAMVDDDEWPGAGWLQELVDVASSLQVDVAGGPVSRVFEVEAIPNYLRRANAVKRKANESGRIVSLESTGNIIFRLGALASMPGPWFDPAFSLTGGGDRDLLLRMRLSGATFGWANEALLYEAFPASRCTREWTLQRAYRVGNSEMLAYLKNKPPMFVPKEIAKALIASARWLVGHTAMAWSETYRFQSECELIRTWGKIRAVLGSRYHEYAVVHGQ